MIDLEGKVAIVTGGCSGIGRGTVNVLRRAGARVACVDVQDEKGHALAKELGDGVLYVHADVTSEDEVAAAFGRVVEHFGGIDTLFNNAGAAEPLDSDPFDLTIFEGVQKLLVQSVVLGIKYAVPSMVARGGGSIVNTASIAGLQAGYGPFAYSVAKGAVVHLSRVAAAALAKDAIRVNAICPGLVETKFAAALTSNDEIAKMVLDRMATKHFGKPDDIAPLALYLASDQSSFMTGEAVVIDGGWTIG